MAIVKCKPTSAGRRHVVKIVNPELHKGKPYAPLLDTKSKTGGRNNYGRITTRHIGNIPVGSTVHNVELKPGKGGQIARSAGAYVQIIAREGNYVTLRLRSGEMRKVLAECVATIGEVGNSEHMLRVLGKAGANRWRGIRPTVRGTAMNPVDHPHGGGEGRNFGKHPVTPWGVQTKGKKTRHNKRTDKYIVRRRGK